MWRADGDGAEWWQPVAATPILAACYFAGGGVYANYSN
jgi:hypothetical protein